MANVTNVNLVLEGQTLRLIVLYDDGRTESQVVQLPPCDHVCMGSSGEQQEMVYTGGILRKDS